MRAAGMSTSAMAVEFGRCFGLRPRAAWRHARGFSLNDAAEAINSCADVAGLDPSGNTVAMTSAHLCEYEGFPGEGLRPTGRRVKPQTLALLARAYGASITDLLDLRDYEALLPADRLVIDACSSAGMVPAPIPFPPPRTRPQPRPWPGTGAANGMRAQVEAPASAAFVPDHAGASYSAWTAAANSAIERNSASGLTSAGGAGVAPQPGRSCRRLIHTVGRPACLAGE